MNIFLTGEPGSGKSTIIKKLLRCDKIAAEAGGILTEEIVFAKKRTGFNARPLSDKEPQLLASVWLYNGPRVGRYTVRTRTIDHVVVPEIKRALSECRLIVIDEIARIQLCSRRFLPVVREALDSPRIILATVHSRDHPLTDPIKKRSDVQLIDVTPLNRDQLLTELQDRLLALMH